MGQGIGQQLSHSSVRVTVFEPLLVEPSQGSSVFVVLRYAGPSGLHEERLDSFPATHVLSGTGPVPAAVAEAMLKVLVVEASSKEAFQAGKWQETGQVSVPLAEVWRHHQQTGSGGQVSSSWATCFMLGLRMKARPQVPKWSPVAGVPEGVPVVSLSTPAPSFATPSFQNEERGGATSSHFDWSFAEHAEEREDAPALAPALDAITAFREAEKLGLMLDVPKVFIAFSDPALDKEKDALAGPSWMTIAPGAANNPLGALGAAAQPAGQNLQAVLEQTNAMMRGLHESLEKECAAVTPSFDLASPGDESAGHRMSPAVPNQLHSVGRAACERLASQNEVLRDRLRHEQHRYDAEVRRLRLEYRAAKRGIANDAGSDGDSGSECDSMEAEEAENFMCRSAEEDRRNMLADLEEVHEQIEALQQKLMHGRTRLASAEHAALIADKEKEQVLNHFSALSYKLQSMGTECRENESLKEALLLAISSNKDVDQEALLAELLSPSSTPRSTLSWLAAQSRPANSKAEGPP
mmetsp:Transcript_86752/g.165773  ORF Transcript_86752/g.165773 Transcript_86752/m.165773 type:complete len:523 (-) Transcript_86752:40-1608(-)